MIRFDVQDMTCGHCVASITRAVQAADPQAQVSVDLAAHQVSITPASADAARLQAAITDAGFTPVPLATASPAPAAARAGCGCSGGCGSR